MNELVKYGNQMNSVPFKKFNKRDLNIFFSIVSRMRDEGPHNVTFSFKALKKLSGINYHGHHGLFLRDLRSTYRKMQNLTIYYSDKDKFVSWVLFTKFEIDNRNRTCTVKVNPDLAGILNNLAKQFTRFSLAEFNRIDSSYAKNMFRLIKQYRTTGHVYMSLNKFRRLLMIPRSYKGGAISRRVLKPILIELCPIVPGLHVVKKYGNYHRIVAYDFIFTIENNENNDFQKNDNNLFNESLMVRTVKRNPYINATIRRRAIAKIIHKPNFQSKVKMPMKSFNSRLKRLPLRKLKQWLKLRDNHIVYLTEYQTRKLRNTIKRQHDLEIKSQDSRKQTSELPYS